MPYRVAGSISGPHQAILRAHVFWPRHCRPRRFCRSDLRRAAASAVQGSSRPEGPSPQRRNVKKHGGPGVQHEGGIAHEPPTGLRCHRHDEPGRGQVRARGGDRLCDMAMITDYDCWTVDAEHVTVEMVIANLMKNAETAKAIIKRVLPQIPSKPGWPCHDALRNAIMTDKKLWPAKAKKDLGPLLSKYL